MSKKLILDSGAFTAHTLGKKIDIDQYGEFVERSRGVFEHAFNLDTINDAKKSYESWKYLKSNGIETIPVYHAATSEKYLKKYLEQTDYIGLGGIAKYGSGQRLLSLKNMFEKYLMNSKGEATVKVHGLGLTALDLVDRFPWYSIDSFTPKMSAAFGGIFLPMIRDNKLDFYNGLIVRISDQATHSSKAYGTFLGLPKLMQKRYEELFEEYGFKLGNITYQKIRPRVKKAGKAKQVILPGMFDLTENSIPDEEHTLANDWNIRMKWNLTMWNVVRKQLPEFRGIKSIKDIEKCIIYIGCSTISQVDAFIEVPPAHDILISYAYMNEPFYKKAKQYKKHKDGN